MDFENNLKSCLKGDGKAPLATVRCSDNFNMRSVIVTRESLWRLCGYGSTSADRYLDDQVRPAVTILMFVVNKKKTGTGGECVAGTTGTRSSAVYRSSGIKLINTTVK